MVLAFNLNRLMQLLVLPLEHKEQRMKALRFHVIQLPGRLIFHARQYVLRVEQSAYELYAFIRKRISALPFAATAPPLGREP